MTIDSELSEHTDIVIKLQELVTVGKISSIETISIKLGIDEESTRDILNDLILNKSINGFFSEDGKRFFLSHVKTSEAPSLPKTEEMQVKESNTQIPKSIGLIGLAMMITGWLLPGLFSNDQGMRNVGIALLMVGMIVMTVGWIQFSRADPPEQLL